MLRWQNRGPIGEFLVICENLESGALLRVVTVRGRLRPIVDKSRQTKHFVRSQCLHFAYYFLRFNDYRGAPPINELNLNRYHEMH